LVLIGSLSVFGCSELAHLYAGSPGTVHEFGQFDASFRPVGLANAIDVKAAQRYTLVLRDDRTIALWGANDNNVLNAPPNLTNVAAIAAGYYMGMALTEDGRVHVWGADGHLRQAAIVNPPESATNIIAIAAGVDHCLALRENGTVVAWGENLYQALNVPVGLDNVVQIAAGADYSLAIKSDGTVVSWGHPTYYGSIPSNATNVIQVAMGVLGYALALRGDGTVVAWSGSPSSQSLVPSGLTNVIAIAAGNQHSVALKADGTLVAWGDDTYGQTTVPQGFAHARAVAAGSRHNAVISSAPFVEGGEPYQWPAAGDVVTLRTSVACPEPFTSQWFKDGLPLSFTNPELVLTNIQANDSGVYTLTASNSFGGSVSVGMPVDVQTSGPRWVAQPEHQAALPGEAASFVAAAAGSEPLSYLWTRDGVPIDRGTNAALLIHPVSPADEGVYAVTISNAYGSIMSDPVYLAATLPVFLVEPSNLRARTNWSVSLDTDILSSSAVAYRWFKDGEELTDQTGARLVFGSLQESDAGEYVVQVSNAVGTVTNGPVRITILGIDFELAEPGVVVDFGNSPYTRPPVLRNATNAVAIAAGTWHTIALMEDRTVRVWADPQNLSLAGVPPSVTNVANVFAGPWYNVALREDGTAVMWGGSSGTMEIGVSNVVSVACGEHHHLLLRRDGTVAASHAVALPTNLTNIVAVAVTSEFSFALRADGQVLQWHNWWPLDGAPAKVIAGLTDIVALAGGESWSSIALRADGQVATLGQSGDWSVVPDITNAVAIAGGRGFAALLAGGEVRTWGVQDTLDVPHGLRAHRIAGGLMHVVALTTEPFFDEHPRSQTLYSEVDGALSAAVRSTSPVSLQWYHDGEPIPGATNSALPLTAPRPSDSGSYHLVAQNARTATASASAAVTVVGPAELLGVTGIRELEAGDPLRLEAEFVAHPAATIMWRFNGLPIPNATNAVLHIARAVESMSGTYSVTLSNVFGATVSPGIPVAVSPSPPRIVTEPGAPPTMPDGAALELRVDAIGSLPLSFQWSFNEEPLVGQTQAMLRLPFLSSVSDGTYRVTITNAYGVATSSPVTVLTTRSAPVTEIVGGTTVVREGKPIRLEAIAPGTDGIRLQWKFNNMEQPGATNLVLMIEAAAPNHAGTYSVSAANAHGTNDSAPVLVTVLPNPGAGVIRSWGLLQAPAGTEVAEAVDAGWRHGVALRPDGTVYAWGGNSYQQRAVPPGLSNVAEVVAGGNFNLALRSDGTVVGWGQNNLGQCSPPEWLKDVVGIAAGDTHALALRSDGSVVAWGYSGYASVPTNLPPAVAIAAGPTYSLSVATDGTVRTWGDGDPSLLDVPSSITNIASVAPAQTVVFALDHSGSIHAWPSAAGIPQDAADLTMLAAGGNHGVGLQAGGRIVAWGNNSYGQVSGPAGMSNLLSIAAGGDTTLATVGEPRIISRPASQLVVRGTPVTLSVNAAGASPLVYRWFLDDNLIPYATNATLFIDAFEAVHSGVYVIEVTNRFNSVRTNFTMLIGQPPVISAEPVDQFVRLGSDATFTVQGTGSPVLRYQWSLNGTNLLDATAATLMIPRVLFPDQGHVSVEVSNAYGRAHSRPAALRIAPLLSLARTGVSLRLRLSALAPNRAHALLTSTNLVDWIGFDTVSSPGTELEIELPVGDEPALFYRLAPPSGN